MNATPNVAPAGASAAGHIQVDTPEFRRTNRALFFAGFSTFALLYTAQPLMPLLSAEFGLSPTESSWSLSASTGTLAVLLLLASALSDVIGRKLLMGAALLASAVLTVLCALAQTYPQLLVLRALLGMALAGVPAVAMAYLSEEIDPLALGRSMGLYIGGTAFGGMLGRILSSLLADFISWRIAFAVIGIAGLLSALEFCRSLPPSRHFQPRRFHAAGMLGDIRRHLSDAGLPWIFLIAFLLMGCFVSVYNYLGYRLAQPPFSLRHSASGAVFSLYLIGIFASVWSGRLADRLGRRKVLWIMVLAMGLGLLLTLASLLIAVIAGLALFTFGFFGAHSIASSWVGRRATTARALASALYLSFYYLGSSLLGSASGLAWTHGGWGGVTLLLGLCLAACLLIAVRLRKLPALS
ncbi:MFS transporter, YNFM family, putative membrane transport protein [Noviherbaspirillum humi]|uniref:MFS transporter, YNFM family, putative membrane transport protein n=1 Tax=Noviherbaspirillum humi TaxID=1688639 RepID=A0A239HEA3_9BURK|nr:MFS transporter [Noviherbaspirillum humi]SNS79680.1 MFS transporter, YNFM family, putative membrane transport protein [Noviherbaspirillum humi]